MCGIDLRGKLPKVRTLASGADYVVAIASGRDEGRLLAYEWMSTATNPTAGYFRVVDRNGRAVRELDIDGIDSADWVSFVRM